MKNYQKTLPGQYELFIVVIAFVQGVLDWFDNISYSLFCSVGPIRCGTL